jgi:bifunctional UDP-N-acetylglucosamine pyrophosphorylase/glucosamine-1-phosphate N-acetyltransferase
MPPAVLAVILAAGRGTRMRSGKAKVLHTLLGRPLLDWVLRAVEAAGAEPVLAVVGHQAEAVEAGFTGRARFIRQDPPLGTGHAVKAAAAEIARHRDRAVLVVNGDLPLLRGESLTALVAHHRATGARATLLSARLHEPGAYGRVVRGEDGAVRAIVEARDASTEQRAIDEINAGVYVFEPTELLAALEQLEARNAQGEYYLTDVIARLVATGARVEAVVAPEPREALGVNSLAELAALAVDLQRERNQALMATGVVIEHPETTWVCPDAEVAPDAVLRAGTFLEGRTRVGRGAVIGPFARLVDCEVGEAAQVLDHCLLREARVGAHATIGPFAHLRPETSVGEGARVGNFVELKKTQLGAGAKAPHLSYLGDAVIGPRANIGAGTITCNYDGQHKHPTQIGEGAFVGSDATLVAPLSVGAGSYVGAGSTITKDVPADALAIGRARQVVKPGWAKRRRDARAKGPHDPGR